MNSGANTKSLDQTFFEEYTSQDAIQKYSKATAGQGISYLLDHDYKRIYMQALDALPAATRARGISILEFGCGAGMNLVHLASVLSRSGVKILKAVGTDFSPVLIEAAVRESAAYLPGGARSALQFHVARNETLAADIAAVTGANQSALAGSFDLILGVNTMRYCHRGGAEMACARDIMALLSPGGICVNIDMNNRFPAFRSALKGMFRDRSAEECYIPTLDEYAAPFEKTGFEILRKEHFCWIPHSAGRFLIGLTRALAPLLNAVAGSRAMRSLVVARRPLSD